jgi:predicted RNA-binding protein associated with RNAse of E/G family
VVEDRPEQRMLFIPARATWKVAAGPDGRELRLYGDEWTLANRASSMAVLSFSWPDRAYAVMAMWDEPWRFLHWYINLETSLRRTPIGFDLVDHCLDVVVSADRSSWRWKDEDELEEAVALGIFTQEEALTFRSDGERAVRHLLTGEPPFDHDWTGWRPDPAWPVPVLPQRWDEI